MTATADLKKSLDSKNFPRWAQACPESFGAMQKAILDAALKMHPMSLSVMQRAELSSIMGHVAATCWAAGRASVKEGYENGLGELT